ncbi:putative phosphatidylinositol 3-kinase, root isoform-like [Capsicum annuum]|uniref:GATA transcription factor 8 n=1 Tax=Capsicum annuum TaxID=4072 RepID=UPI0007BF427E|nr:GATA transcription factor 8 [Capsicum annuum]XP_047268336.1 GATA transcription factor 8 [Capsicum annuum]KAF3618175.1 putative phosphatidylinositol 3-kinase, root isoform-like [Capsicum annuum]
MGSNFGDEIDCSSFFDHMEDLIEFSPENECGGLDAVDCKDFPSWNDECAGLDAVGCKDFQNIWNDPLPDTEPLFSGSYSNSASDFSAELSVPYEDIAHLEWLSTFVEDSFSCEGLTLGKEHCRVDKEPSDSKFLTSSPVSVLESSSSSSSSSSSCSGPGKTIPPLSPCHHGPQRARSKRPRPTTFNPRPVNQLMFPTSLLPQQFVVPPGVHSLESESFAEESSPMKKKKKRIKFSIPRPPIETLHDDHNPEPQEVRKCLHCEITRTPQWRAGPMGPKSLCNACGVRYKKGRLYPEYRPAASPTFVPSLHSNSHKKVMEMRTSVFPDDTQYYYKPPKPSRARPLTIGQAENTTTTTTTASTLTAQLDVKPE